MRVTSWVVMTEDEQRRRRDWFGRHWEDGVPFNRLCGMKVARWDIEGVTLRLPFAEQLSAHTGIFHGGVVSALIDTAATGSVMAGHDFDLGTQPVTLTLSVQYLSVAPGEDLVADAACTKRGRTNFAEVRVTSPAGNLLALGMVTVAVTGRAPAGPAS
jgi:uncharacterized protein (TIGR00369 family)